MSILDAVKFDAKGLVCAIAQDEISKRILMVAWMNAEALEKTLATGQAHYFSRSRQKLWHKGEESGHTQDVSSVHLDCDGDAVLMMIKQHGGMACHTGRESCFYRQYQDGQWVTIDPVLKSEAEIYGQ